MAVIAPPDTDDDYNDYEDELWWDEDDYEDEDDDIYDDDDYVESETISKPFDNAYSWLDIDDDYDFDDDYEDEEYEWDEVD